MATAILADLALTTGLGFVTPADAAAGGPLGRYIGNVAIGSAPPVIVPPASRSCARSYHPGPKRRRCWPN